MKPTVLPRIIAAILTAAALTLGTRMAQAQNDCCPTFTPGNVANATIGLADPTTNPPAAIFINVANNAGPVAAGNYFGWCIDHDTDIWPGTYPGTLISTCDTNEFSLIPNHLGNPPVGPDVPLSVWNEVNWLINHRAGYLNDDVQNAINSLVGGPPTALSPAAQTLSAAAQANPNFSAQCGDKHAVIFDSDYFNAGNKLVFQQLLILELPSLPPVFANCVSISITQNVAITPVQMVAGGGCGGPYTFLASGLPAGLTMSASGLLSGTPTASGFFPYTVKITDKCGNQNKVYCSLVVPPPQFPPLGHGDTATIGFWHNKNGQALINSMNGGPTSTNLGTWLAINYPCLFGNLYGKANTVVASQFMTYFNVKGTKTYAQVLAGALADYVTSSTLAGGSTAAGYGFNVTPAGTGAKTYNVGANGAAIGLVNNTSYTVAQLLQAANAKCPWNSAVFNALNSIFDGLNTSGDII